jgi:hypothetical protein
LEKLFGDAMIFKFWNGLAGDVRVHPEDALVLSQINHSYNLTCLPGPYRGPLKGKAKVVLLFANPGLTQQDIEHASQPEAWEYYQNMRSGEHPLPSEQEHQSAHSWLSQIAKQFGLCYDQVRRELATLNLSAYKSERLDRQTLIAIPSCRVTLDWAQSTLFRRARAKEVVVVCMRSHSSWGLKPDGQPEGYLFAPSCTQNGFIRQSSPIRQATIEAVKRAFS